ncbi:hypothetical protein H0H92_000532 [Tricholoma furcatifolium]|nr:hypothetical protein H0H92_000532 [Tricholoma furcatifolium]
MAQSTEERRQKHNAACQRYRDRNLDKYRTSARERMRRLRARRKEDLSTTGASDNFRNKPTPSTLNTQELEMQLLMATLPPSSEPDYSDSDVSDIHKL